MLKNGCRRAMNNYSTSDQSALITTAWIWGITFTFVGTFWNVFDITLKSIAKFRNKIRKIETSFRSFITQG